MLMDSRAEVIRGWPNDGARERNEVVTVGASLQAGDLVEKQLDGTVNKCSATKTKRVGLVVRGNFDDASASGAIGTFSYAANISAASAAAGVVTISVPTTTGMAVGSLVTVAGITVGTGYNGQFVVTGVVANTSFTVANAVAAGAATVTNATATLNTAANNTGKAVVLWGNYIVRTQAYTAGAYVPGSPVTAASGVFALANGTTDPEVGYVLSVQGAVSGTNGTQAHLTINAY